MRMLTPNTVVPDKDPVKVDLAVLESLCGSKLHADIVSYPASKHKGEVFTTWWSTESGADNAHVVEMGHRTSKNAPPQQILDVTRF